MRSCEMGEWEDPERQMGFLEKKAGGEEERR